MRKKNGKYYIRLMLEEMVYICVTDIRAKKQAKRCLYLVALTTKQEDNWNQ